MPKLRARVQSTHPFTKLRLLDGNTSYKVYSEDGVLLMAIVPNFVEGESLVLATFLLSFHNSQCSPYLFVSMN